MFSQNSLGTLHYISINKERAEELETTGTPLRKANEERPGDLCLQRRDQMLSLLR